jgi:hypothetical protein
MKTDGMSSAAATTRRYLGRLASQAASASQIWCLVSARTW